MCWRDQGRFHRRGKLWEMVWMFLSKEEQILGIGHRCSHVWGSCREENKKYPAISSSSPSYPGRNDWAQSSKGSHKWIYLIREHNQNDYGGSSQPLYLQLSICFSLVADLALTCNSARCQPAGHFPTYFLPMFTTLITLTPCFPSICLITTIESNFPINYNPWDLGSLVKFLPP